MKEMDRKVILQLQAPLNHGDIMVETLNCWTESAVVY